MLFVNGKAHAATLQRYLDEPKGCPLRAAFENVFAN